MQLPLFSEKTKLSVRKIDFSVACEFVRKHHRHCKPPIGHIFSIGCFKNNILVGVAIVGRPVARRLDNGRVVEITRLATDGTRNACSKLYALSVKYAKILGFEKVITYTLVSENGASLRASAFVLEASNVGGIKWTSKRSLTRASKGVVSAPELKNRWCKII